METQTPVAHKVRTACDVCHKSKMKCSRGNPCVACARAGNQCRYSISNRLGRPPKAAPKNKKAGAITRSKERGPHRQPSAAAAQLFLGDDHSQPEDLPTLDDMFMDAFSDSSYTLSSPEVLTNRGFTNIEDTNNTTTTNNLSPLTIPFKLLTSSRPVQDDQQPAWSTILDQLQQSPAVGLEPFNSPQNSPQPIYNTSILLDSTRDHGYRGELTRCHCLQQHTRFLCDLKDLDRIHHPRFVTVTLDAAKQGLHLWQAHLSCRSCWHDEDSGALLLLVMSIGTIVKRLWHLLTYQQQQQQQQQQRPQQQHGRPGQPGQPGQQPQGGDSGSPSTNSSASGFPGMGIPRNTPAAAEPVPDSATGAGGANRGEPLRHDPTVALMLAPPMKINVGEFQVPEEEQMFVVGMLTVRMLRRIEEGLEDLRGRIGQEKRGDGRNDEALNPPPHPHHHRHPLSRLVPLILENLDESVRELEQSFKGFIMR
ncbi:hypothetical protein AAE478_007929 [Parahypoxylon ruwenzoriense]